VILGSKVMCTRHSGLWENACTQQGSPEFGTRDPRACMYVCEDAQSSTRQLLLKEMGVVYECEPADIDEKAIRHDDPQV
jgi:hypothetical protein